MSPRDLSYWAEALCSTLPPNRYTNTPRKWFLNVWFWELKGAWWHGTIKYRSTEK